MIGRFGIFNIYKTEVISELKLGLPEKELLTQADIDHLPKPVQNYLEYTGVIGKEKVHSIRLSFTGDFKFAAKQNWIRCIAEQYNFFENLKRIFYIKVKMFGLSIKGRDLYSDGKGNMLIRLASLIPVANARGREMDIAEMVTLFNDMCLMAPATLIDPRIHWQIIDSLTVKGIFEANGQTVSALLYFNVNGELINFISDDRYYISGKTRKKVRWSTPVTHYTEMDGIRIPSVAEAVWHLPEGDYHYAKFELKGLEYNCRQFKKGEH